MSHIIVIVLWCLLQYRAEEVNCQLHIEVRNYSHPFSSSDTHTRLYEFNEPELSMFSPKWFNFYPYANIESDSGDYFTTGTNIGSTGYLYEILDCDDIEEPNSGIQLPSSHNLWFALIRNYTKSCHNSTIARLEDRGYYLLFAYNDDGDQTISQEDKDSGFPIAILTENHALELLFYYNNVNFSSGITSDIPVIYFELTEKDRIINSIVSVVVYITAAVIGIAGCCCLLYFCGSICDDITCCSNTQDDESIELRRISRRNREDRANGDPEVNRSTFQMRSTTTTTERETRVNSRSTSQSIRTVTEGETRANRGNVRSTSRSTTTATEGGTRANRGNVTSTSRSTTTATEGGTRESRDNGRSTSRDRLTLTLSEREARVNTESGRSTSREQSTAILPVGETRRNIETDNDLSTSRVRPIIILPQGETDGSQIDIAGLQQLINSAIIITTGQQQQQRYERSLSNEETLGPRVAQENVSESDSPPPLPPRQGKEEPLYGNVKPRSTLTDDNKWIRKYDPQTDSERACSICLDDFNAGEDVRCLDCDQDHIFHSDCLDTWFSKGEKRCPLCRTKSQ